MEFAKNVWKKNLKKKIRTMCEQCLKSDFPDFADDIIKDINEKKNGMKN